MIYQVKSLFWERYVLQSHFQTIRQETCRGVEIFEISTLLLGQQCSETHNHIHTTTIQFGQGCAKDNRGGEVN